MRDERAPKGALSLFKSLVWDADSTPVTFTLSPPVRIAAALGLIASVVLFGGMKMMGGGADEAPVSVHAINPHPFGIRKPTPTAAKPAPTKAKLAKPAATATKPKAQPRPATPAIDRAAIAAAIKAGLPTPLATALGRYKTVVVSLYDPYSQVDGIAFAEARAGAALAGVGFVPLNVLSQAQVGKLTEQLGLLPDPGILVYVRPGTLVAKMSGFMDKETVAQTAHNATNTTGT